MFRYRNILRRSPLKTTVSSIENLANNRVVRQSSSFKGSSTDVYNGECHTIFHIQQQYVKEMSEMCV